MRLLLFVTLLSLLAGCATPGQRNAEQSYYDAVAAQAAQERLPLVEIRALPGQEITGLQSITVYAPGSGSASIAPYRAQHHPAWSIAGDALRIGLPLWLGGRAAVDLADTVGKRVGDVARDVTVVEQPAPVVVDSPDPVIVPAPDPIIVPAPEPIIVPSPDPIIVPGGGE